MQNRDHQIRAETLVLLLQSNSLIITSCLRGYLLWVSPTKMKLVFLWEKSEQTSCVNKQNILAILEHSLFDFMYQPEHRLASVNRIKDNPFSFC